MVRIALLNDCLIYNEGLFVSYTKDRVNFYYCRRKRQYISLIPFDNFIKKPSRLHVSCVRLWFNISELRVSYSSFMKVGLKAGNMNLRGAYFHMKVSSQCPRILNLDEPSLLISSMES